MPIALPVQVGSVLRETYEIVSPLGSGGMGAVYVARHLRLPGKQVAVKVLRPGSAILPEAAARFRREAEIASRLGHPNIVEVMDFDTTPDGTPFLVMELLLGESLGQRLRRGPLGWEEVKAIARQVASALRAAHRAGVVHRDLKPDNVFLTPSEAGGVVIERVKLLDFGISKLTAEAATGITHDQVLMGTPRYMSPEQAVGKNSDVDERTDIFAFGSIVYEMLAGKPPFAGENTAQVVFQIVQAVPEPIASLCPSLPRRAAAAIARAMAKEARERFPDVESFVAALTGEPLHSLSGLGGTPVPVRRTAARRRVPWIVAGALGLSSLVAWGGLTWWGRTSPGRAGSTAAVHGGAGVPAGGASGPSGAEAAAVPPVPGSEVPVGPPAAIPSVSPAAIPSVPSAVFPSAKPAPEKAGSGPLSPPSKAATSSASAAAPSAQAVAPSEKSVTAPVGRAGQPSKAAAAVSRSAVAPPERARPSERTASRTSPQRSVPEARAQEARGLLSGAHRALAAGEARKAIELARRAERGDPSLPTAPVLTMAYCALGDLGNARPELARVRWGQRRFVRRFCARQGLDLGER